MYIRAATGAEMDEVGEIRVAAYVAGGFLSSGSGYARTLRELGADGGGHVLVAVDADRAPESPPGADADGRPGAGRIIGTIMLQVWPHSGQVTAGPGEAEIRALAVRPEAQGSGVGGRLVRAVIELAAGLGMTYLLLSTEPEMRTAHRLYERAGFVRLPDRDWSPVPEVKLLVYGLPLA